MNFLDNAKLLYKKAEEMGLQPKWLTDYGLFSINVEDKMGYVAYSNSLFNNSLSSYLARNKHVARVIFAQHDLPNIPFALPETKKEVEDFLKKYNPVIVKPTLGTSSRDIHFVRSFNDIKKLDLQNYIFEQYIKGREMRYLVFNKKVIAVHEKQHDELINNPETVRRISYPQQEWDHKLVQLAVRVAEVLSLTFAAVDFIIDEEDQAFILEVNSAPGLYFFQYPTKGPGIDIARMYLEETVKTIKRQISVLQ